MKEIFVNTEYKLIIPSGVVAAVRVDPRREFPVRVDPGDGVGPHRAGHWGEVLCGDDVQLQELKGCKNCGRHSLEW